MRDFDDMVKMYQDDPDGFEAEAREAIDDYISAVPEECQERLRQLQWRIDGTLKPIKNPTARMNKMVEIFWPMVQEGAETTAACCAEIQARLAGDYQEPAPEIEPDTPPATVLNFTRTK